MLATSVVADIRKYYQWLKKAGLTDSTEALILAAQEQALGTRSIEAGVYHTRQEPRCRLCKDAGQRAKLLWYIQIQTDRKVLVNQPDIVVIDKEKKEAVVIDIAVPSNSNIKKKEYEKLEKHQGLKEELERTWKVKVKVVPVVIGALGAVTPKLEC